MVAETLSDIQALLKTLHPPDVLANDTDLSCPKELCRAIRSIVRNAYKPGSNLQQLIDHNKMTYKGHLLSKLYSLPKDAESQKQLFMENPNLFQYFLYHRIAYYNYKVARIDLMANRVKLSKMSLLVGFYDIGRTDLIMNYLFSHWGIYLTAQELNGGSKDLFTTLKSQKPATDESFEETTNLAKKMFTILTVRRFFLSVLHQEFGKRVKPYHWLAIQYDPECIFGRDVFEDLVKSFKFSSSSLELAVNKRSLPVFLDGCDKLLDLTNESSESLHFHSKDVFKISPLYKPDKKPCNSALSPIHWVLSELIDMNYSVVLTGSVIFYDELRPWRIRTWLLRKIPIVSPQLVFESSRTKFRSFRFMQRVPQTQEAFDFLLKMQLYNLDLVVESRALSDSKIDKD